MATYIKTGSSGSVEYEIEPGSTTEMLPNEQQGGGDPAEIAALVERAEAAADRAMSGTPEGYASIVQSISGVYSSEATYNADDIVFYENSLYQATENITTAEAWTPGHWQQITISGEIAEILADIEDLYSESKITIFSEDVENGTWYYSKKSAPMLSRLRSKKLYPVKAGSVVSYNVTGLKLYLGVVTSITSQGYAYNSGWIPAGTEGKYEIPINGYLVIIFERINTSVDLTPANYTGDVYLYGPIYKTIDSISAGLNLQNMAYTIRGDIYNVLNDADVEQGSWSYSSKVNSSKRIRSKSLISVTSGQNVLILNSVHRFYFGILQTTTSNDYLFSSGWLQPSDQIKSFRIPVSGYMTFIWESDTDITPLDFYDTWVSVRPVGTIDYFSEINNLTNNLYKLFKRVGVIGDSLSVGYNYSEFEATGALRNLPLSWVQAATRDSGNTWLNFGTSGQTVLSWASDPVYGKAQLEATGTKSQAYIIGLGVNDETGSPAVPLGTIADCVEDPDQVATTFYGGYNRIIRLIKRVNDKALIFILTSPRTYTSVYNDAIRAIKNSLYATDANIILIDLAYRYYFYFSDPNYTISTQKDHAHYTPAGYLLIAKVMELALSDAITLNMNAVKDVALIPYDTGEPPANTYKE